MKIIRFLVLSCSLLFPQSDPPLIIAHRGASADAPENTLAAFNEAVGQKADALEIDIRQTKEGTLVVIHDSKVNRTTDGKGKISAFTLTELRNLDAGSWFSSKFKDERIPTLKETLTLLDSITRLIIEIKSEEEGIEQKVIDEIDASGKRNNVILKSFNTGAVRRFKALAPDIPRIYVFAAYLSLFRITIGNGISFEDPFQIPADYLQIHWLAATRSFIENAHARNYKVIVWGVDTEPEMKSAIGYNVDGIETDHPGILYSLISARKQ